VSRRHSESEIVEIEADLVHETPRAYLVSDGDRECWLPKSLTQYDGHGTFAIPEWLAMREGLI